MPINLRSGTTNIPDGSITEAKLAPDSVSSVKIQANAVIDTKIAPSAVTNTKIATDAVTDTKIASNAVTTPKIAADAVTTDKVTNDLATQHFFGAEQELTHMTDTPTSVAEFNFLKTANDAENWKSISYSGKLKSSNAANTAQFRLYIDGVPRGSDQSTTNTTYTPFGEAFIDISALAVGNHLVELFLDNSNVGETAFLGAIDVYLGKKI